MDHIGSVKGSYRIVGVVVWCFVFGLGLRDVVVRVWDLRDMKFFGLSNPKP